MSILRVSGFLLLCVSMSCTSSTQTSNIWYKVDLGEIESFVPIKDCSGQVGVCIYDLGYKVHAKDEMLEIVEYGDGHLKFQRRLISSLTNVVPSQVMKVEDFLLLKIFPNSFEAIVNDQGLVVDVSVVDVHATEYEALQIANVSYTPFAFVCTNNTRPTEVHLIQFFCEARGMHSVGIMVDPSVSGGVHMFLLNDPLAEKKYALPKDCSPASLGEFYRQHLLGKGEFHGQAC